MAAETEILDAGMLHMAAYSTSLPVSYPATPFKAPSGEEAMWLEIRYFPNVPRNLGWENDARQEYIGAFRISVYFRTQYGSFTATEEAEALIAHFAKGTELGPVRVSQRPYLAPVVDSDNGAAFITVTIPYRGIS